MRIALSIIFVLLLLLLGVCTALAKLSRKPIGNTLSIFVSSLIPPVSGNLFLLASDKEILSTIGCYIYFIGMNYVMAAVTFFTAEYCGLEKKYKWVKWVKAGVLIILIADTISILCNIFFGHAFTMTFLPDVWGEPYYQFVPGIGQIVHRIIDYAILAGVLITFLVKTIREPRVYKERYAVILLAMVLVSAWQTFYIISGTPVDISMIGFAVFGVLVFFLSLYYRPLRLLDRMLASLASRMPECLFFFDSTGRCIWANRPAMEFLGISGTDLEPVAKRLEGKIGVYRSEENNWTRNVSFGKGENLVCYALEKHQVVDDQGHVLGNYVSVRDCSEEQRAIQRESYNAIHDPLTKILNRAGYDQALERVSLNETFLLLFDLDSFKETNDHYGHVIGDKVLINVAETIQRHFDNALSFCRIGGDEFAIILSADSDVVETTGKRIAAVNLELLNHPELPPTSISSGGAFGKDAENAYELYNNADHALYETKFSGKKGFTLFNRR